MPLTPRTTGGTTYQWVPSQLNGQVQITNSIPGVPKPQYCYVLSNNLLASGAIQTTENGTPQTPIGNATPAALAPSFPLAGILTVGTLATAPPIPSARRPRRAPAASPRSRL